MAARAQYRYTVAVEVHQEGTGALLDWVVYRAPLGDPLRKRWKHRRILIRDTGPLSIPQLTVLAGRMGAYVLSGQPGQHAVPRGLPWREPGATEWSVPLGEGEGGGNRTPGLHRATGRPDHPELSERGIR